jgi:hypothetical protein
VPVVATAGGTSSGSERPCCADREKGSEAVSPVAIVWPCPLAIDTFRAPYAGESLTAALQALHRFHGLHPDFGCPALPAPALTGGTPNDAAGFASCYGPHRRSPLQGF